MMSNTTEFKMDVDDLSILQFLNGSKHFVIPVFQRNYAWTPRNCEQLYNDLIKIKDEPDKIHFFGSIVSVGSANGRRSKYQIIDGQQRITTTTLLILAMYKSIKQGIITSNDSELEKDLHSYLFDVSEKPKLHPNKKDQKAFEKLFDESAEYDKSSNLTTNFNFFYEHIQEAKITIDDLITAINRLVIVSITLPNGGNPQLVFESLNSTGLDLTESDKVRNYLLMNLEPAQQEDYYLNYWKKIENNTHQSLDMFIRDYLSIKTSTPPSEKNIYFAFKKYKESKELQVKDLLDDLRKYAISYSILLGKSTINYSKDCSNAKTKTAISHITACILRLNYLKQNVIRPFFLEVLRLYNEGQLPLKEVYDIFRFTENYIFRRQICGIQSQGLNKMFIGLHNEIIRLDGTSSQYLEKYKYTLLSKRKDKHQFPTDEDFGKNFVTQKIYNSMRSKYVIYILERLENFGTNETKDVYQLMKDQVYTVEHIVPQSVNSQWIKDLGDECKNIYDNWLDRMPNLTLVLKEYNSKYQNKSFIIKRDCKNGYRDSGFRMNQHIAQCNSWGLKELQERSIILTKKALEIWERPQTNFVPAQKELILSLREDDDSLGMSSDRHILRQAFWDYAVPILRKHNQNSRAFDKVNRSAENGLNGRIGMRHFYLTAMANYDKAKAALSFVSNDKAKNKSVFDELYRHKDEIEKELGVALVWERNDDNKSSKIYFALNNVSITKREDWDKMAEFQGIWCAKLYDKIVVPYLKPMLSLH